MADGRMARCGWSICPNGWASPTIPTTTLTAAQCDDIFRGVNDLRPRTMSSNRSSSWAGGNDFLQEYDSLWFDDSADGADRVLRGQSFQRRGDAFTQKAPALSARAQHGGRHRNSHNQLPALDSPGHLRGKVLQFNIELALALDRIQTTLPQLRLYRVDFSTPR